PEAPAAALGEYTHGAQFAAAAVAGRSPRAVWQALPGEDWAARLAELAAEVFPPGVVNIVVGDGPTTPDRLVRHPAVRRIGFIGSEPTGRAIQRAAAESAVKHVTLELGGKNAMVVFDDCDVDEVASGAV
ncbi:aldehyde dehydrogenase family protein, partial [Mycobacterium kansasii]